MTKRMTLDRGAGIAIWRQIKEWLKTEIASGAFEKGSRLPTESEIAARFGVNRHTVRRAIAALTNEGVLRADQGRGTFVASAPLSYPIGSRTRFSEIVSGQNKTASGRMIGSGNEEADALLADCLNVPIGTLLTRIETLRVVEGAPVLVGTSWFDQDLFPTLVKAYAETGSFTAAMKQNGVDDYTRKQTRISAEIIDPQDAVLLEMPPGLPVLVLESINVDLTGTPIQYTRTRMAADRVQLVVES